MLPRSSVLLLLLGLLVFTASPLAGAAGMDRDGDGEITVDEFLAGGDTEKDCKASAAGKEAHEEAVAGAAAEEVQDEQATAAELAAAKAAVNDAVSKGVPIPFDSNAASVLLDGSQNAFLKFSTSWCGHCVKMQPDWEKLANTVHKDFKGCRVVSVDCEKDAEVCQAFGVQGYPTLMLLKIAKTPEGEVGYQPVPYQQARDYSNMLGFLRKEKAVKAKNIVKTMVSSAINFVQQIFKIEVSMPK